MPLGRDHTPKRSSYLAVMVQLVLLVYRHAPTIFEVDETTGKCTETREMAHDITTRAAAAAQAPEATVMNTIGVSPFDIKTLGADTAADSLPEGSGNNRLKISCSSPDKVKMTQSYSEYGYSWYKSTPSTDSTGDRESKIYENGRFKHYRRENYRRRDTRIIKLHLPHPKDPRENISKA